MPPIAVFVALADATRCQIVALLQKGARPVHSIAAEFRISRPAISRHLRVLKQAGLISEDKMGRENLYRLHAEALMPVQLWVEPFLAREEPAAEPPAEKVAASEQRVRKHPAMAQMGFDF